MTSKEVELILDRIDRFEIYAREKLDYLESEVRGNGKPGLKQRVDALEERAKYIGAGILGILGVCVTLVIDWIKKQFKV